MPWAHIVLWFLTYLPGLTAIAIGIVAIGDIQSSEVIPRSMWHFLGAAIVSMTAYLYWRRHIFLVRDLKNLLRGLRASQVEIHRTWRGIIEVQAQVGEFWLIGSMNTPIIGFWAGVDVDETRDGPRLIRRKQPDYMFRGTEMNVFRLGDFSHVPAFQWIQEPARPLSVNAKFSGALISATRPQLKRFPPVTGHTEVDRALQAAAATVPTEAGIEGVEVTSQWLRVRFRGGAWLGAVNGDRIEMALTFARNLAGSLAALFTPRNPDRWQVKKVPASVHPMKSATYQVIRLGEAAGAGAYRLIVGMLLFALSSLGHAANIDDGVAFLVNGQSSDGSWVSTSVAQTHATAEALQALRGLGVAATSRDAGADWLQLQSVTDNDQRGRRIEVLAMEGRDVSAEVTTLLGVADPSGGWGLVAEFGASSLDSAIALRALNRAGVGGPAIQKGLTFLVAAQNADGGWACVNGAVDSNVSCSAEVLLALATYRTQFVLDSAIMRARDFLNARVNADGSIGPAESDTFYATAMAVRALVAIGDNLGASRSSVMFYLSSQQRTDGSWATDSLLTAVALQAVDGLASVPICGDGAVNGAFEFCDGADLAGQTCDSLGFGPGGLSCTASCAFETSACSALPVCGDGVRNAAGEFCDGVDLGGSSCPSLGFTGGALSCATDCSFNAAACTGTAAYCGDGAVNRPTEQCDRGDFAGQSCGSLGLGAGTLRCGASCSVDTSGCSGTAGAYPPTIEFGSSSEVCSSGTETVPIRLTFPPASTINKVDVFLLFDDTGSFAGLVPSVNSIFSQLVTDLQTALPGVDFGYGVGRFEDFGGPGSAFSGEFSAGRPFTLNQPIITTTTPNFLTLINGALARTAPGYGGDGPETSFESLYQVATGAGFDGDGNGSSLDSGPTGLAATQTNPGSSGDVPPFSSNVAVASGSQGGVGFRDGAVRFVILATDICSVAAYDPALGVPTTITSLNGVTLPTASLHCSSGLGSNRFGFLSNSKSTSGNTVSGAVAPAGAATVPAMVQALNAAGISVIGLAPGGAPIQNPVSPSTLPSTFLSAIALLTGATDSTGKPLVFNISGGAGPLRTAVVNAITTAATRPVDVRVRAVNVPAGVTVSFAPDVVSDVGPGGQADFDMSVRGVAANTKGGFDIQFYDAGTNAVLGSIPVTLSCSRVVIEPPVDGDGDGFPSTVDCDDSDPSVNPAQTEIPGNDKDDDCNPATPDVVAIQDLVCVATTDKVSYGAQENIRVDVALTNVGDAPSLAGLSLNVSAVHANAESLGSNSESLAPIAKGERRQRSFFYSTGSMPPGGVNVLAQVKAGGTVRTECVAQTSIVSPATLGVQLVGKIVAEPGTVTSGNIGQAILRYSLTNAGNTTLSPTAIEILIVDPGTGLPVAQLTDGTVLGVGASYDSTKPTPRSLATGEYLVVLRGGQANDLATLNSTGLKVVNAPPSCVRAAPTVIELWPPNHAFTSVGVRNITDPDGDPLTTRVTAVFQDETVLEKGSGNTCPDAVVKSDRVDLRAERAGSGDGRVYRVRIEAEDPAGAHCDAVISVCVPHDGSGKGCIDSGQSYPSTSCPVGVKPTP